MADVTLYTNAIRALCDKLDAEYANGNPPDPQPQRSCYFGYFGDNPTIVDEIKDHADLAWPYGWPSGQTDMKVAQDAKAAGMRIMLPVYGVAPQEDIEYFLRKCDDADILDAVVAIYPQDEPDVAGMSDAEVRAMVQRTRAAADNFPEIADAPIAAIYGNQGWPGIDAFDWIGHDDYGNGPQILPLAPHQRLMLVPGGMNDWREHPDEFVAYAQSHPEVVAVVAFMWQAPDDATGKQSIKANGMATSYRAAGKTLTHR